MVLVYTAVYTGMRWSELVGLRRSGVDNLRFHDLRHTAVALAVSQGAHPKAIQRRMGHSTINVTLDRDGHLFSELDQKVASDVGATLRQASRAASTGTIRSLQ